jgi:hypothetical protein
VPSYVAQEVLQGVRGQVADGDDAVVAGCSAQWGAVAPVGAAPDRDAGLLQRTGEELDIVDVKMGAVVVDVLPRPELGDDLESLVEELGVGSVVSGFSEGGELPGVVGADAGAEDEAAA